MVVSNSILKQVLTQVIEDTGSVPLKNHPIIWLKLRLMWALVCILHKPVAEGRFIILVLKFLPCTALLLGLLVVVGWLVLPHVLGLPLLLIAAIMLVLSVQKWLQSSYTEATVWFSDLSTRLLKLAGGNTLQQQKLKEHLNYLRGSKKTVKVAAIDVFRVSRELLRLVSLTDVLLYNISSHAHDVAVFTDPTWSTLVLVVALILIAHLHYEAQISYWISCLLAGVVVFVAASRRTEKGVVHVLLSGTVLVSALATVSGTRVMGQLMFQVALVTWAVHYRLVPSHSVQALFAIMISLGWSFVLYLCRIRAWWSQDFFSLASWGQMLLPIQVLLRMCDSTSNTKDITNGKELALVKRVADDLSKILLCAVVVVPVLSNPVLYGHLELLHAEAKSFDLYVNLDEYTKDTWDSLYKHSEDAQSRFEKHYCTWVKPWSTNTTTVGTYVQKHLECKEPRETLEHWCVCRTEGQTRHWQFPCNKPYPVCLKPIVYPPWKYALLAAQVHPVELNVRPVGLNVQCWSNTKLIYDDSEARPRKPPKKKTYRELCKPKPKPKPTDAPIGLFERLFEFFFGGPNQQVYGICQHEQAKTETPENDNTKSNRTTTDLEQNKTNSEGDNVDPAKGVKETLDRVNKLYALLERLFTWECIIMYSLLNKVLDHLNCLATLRASLGKFLTMLLAKFASLLKTVMTSMFERMLEYMLDKSFSGLSSNSRTLLLDTVLTFSARASFQVGCELLGNHLGIDSIKLFVLMFFSAHLGAQSITDI